VLHYPREGSPHVVVRGYPSQAAWADEITVDMHRAVDRGSAEVSMVDECMNTRVRVVSGFAHVHHHR
jgi:hypothetical protein